MRVLIVGVGAVGGFFGAALAQAGADVTFLARGRRLEQLRASGVEIVQTDASRTATPVNAVPAAELEGPYDLVILAVKGTAVEPAIADIRSHLGPDTAILPLLNGIAHLATLTRLVGAPRVLGGVGIVATELLDDGSILQLAPAASITFGELDGTRSARVETIARLFAPAAFDSAISTTIEQDMWEKWFFMATGGASTVLLGGDVGEIADASGGASVVLDIIAEAAATAASAGHAIRPEAVNRVTATLTTAGSPFTTSLYRDFRAGRAAESEPILGDLVAVAERGQLQVPLLRAAAVRLRTHNARVAAKAQERR
ncbi:2-dehydropantoate 2-reductase [Gryllotalpicola reticulitermitis]|uniref:2-dehydropantoate 2-reductase n=1 Tax=Gryllotalpicola reticulitermitis TaxID=1184153 RepID=A0ABV8Q5F5_9MICO